MQQEIEVPYSFASTNFLATLIHGGPTRIVMVALIIIAIGGAATLLKKFGIFAKRRRSNYRFKAAPVLTKNEVRLFQILIKEFPSFYFFPQVGMGAVLAPDYQRNDRRYLPAFRSVSQKRLDFLVCNKSLEAVCLLELDDSSHSAAKDKIRDETTAIAGYKTVRLKTAKIIDLSPLSEVIVNSALKKWGGAGDASPAGRPGRKP